MDILSFYQQQNAVERKAFADALGTSLQYYRNVATGFRRAGETIALAIERESSGRVKVADIRPEFAAALTASGYRKRKAA